MSKFCTYNLVLYYLFAGIAPALHFHDHLHVKLLESVPEQVVDHSHSGCSHHHHQKSETADKHDSNHSHQQSPYSPHDHSDDCIVCQIAIQASIVEASEPTIVSEEFATPVVQKTETVLAEQEYSSLVVRGPPAEIC